MNVTARLLLAIIQGDPDAPALVRADPEGVDWEGLEAATRTFRALTLENMHATGLIPEVPQASLSRWEDGARLEVLLHVRRQALIRSAIFLLSDAGIDVVFLKGVGLAHMSYPRPELRPMTDLDLWVGQTDVDRVGDALWPMGMTEPFRFQAIPRVRGVLMLERPGTATLMELHPAPDSLCDLWTPEELEAAWQRAIEIDVGGVTARVMAPEDLLIHTCLHLSYNHHFDLGIRPYIDVAMLLKSHRPELDWNAVVERSVSHPETAVWMDVVLRTTSRLFGTDIPDHVTVALGGSDGRVEMVDVATDLALSHRGLRGTFIGELVSIPTLMGRFKAILRRGTIHYTESSFPNWVVQLAVDVFARGPRQIGRWLRGGYDRRSLDERRSQVERWERLEALAMRDMGRSRGDSAGGS